MVNPKTMLSKHFKMVYSLNKTGLKQIKNHENSPQTIDKADNIMHTPKVLRAPNLSPKGPRRICR